VLAAWRTAWDKHEDEPAETMATVPGHG